MTNNDTTFDAWFDVLQFNVLDRTGHTFNDRESVREDFEDGRDVFDVADEISEEYGEDEEE
jgi:hypothetical protein